MIDLTSREQDKKNFITGIKFNESEPKMFVMYADGHEDVKDFSVHDYNNLLVMMENQYRSNVLDFKQNIANVEVGNSFMKKVALAIGTLGYAISLNISRDITSSIVLCSLITLILVWYLLRLRNVDKKNKDTLKYLELVDELIKNKDKFRIEIKDPVTGKDDVWYYYSIADIDDIVNNKMEGNIALYASLLGCPDYREELGEVVEKSLKFNLGMEKKYE